MMQLQGNAIITKHVVFYGKDASEHLIGGSVEQVAGPKVQSDMQLVPVGTVKFGVGATVPTGPYEGVKYFVGLDVPAPITELESVYAWTKQWCEAKLQACVSETMDANAAAG
jgi:hypothetical protein